MSLYCDDINVEEERMNKDVNGNEYTFRTPSDWGAITGVLILQSGGKYAYARIDPESGDLKFVMER